MNRFFFAAVALPLAALSAQGQGAASAELSEAIPVANYVLQPSDLIQVRIFQEPDLDRELRVSQDLQIALPLIGQVSVRNLSVRQLEQQIRDLYDRDYLVNPQVNVSVVQYAPRLVSVLGSVNSPGPVPFPPEEPLRLIDAIARAGGFSRLANTRNVQLNRKNADGSTTTIVVNAEDLMRGTSSEAYLLQRDDVINVQERVF